MKLLTKVDKFKNLNKNQIISLIIYVIGVVCVVIFLLKALLGGENVANSQAMLPVTAFEANCIILGIGFIPMILSTIYLIHSYEVKKPLYRILVLIPCVIAGIPFVIIAGTLILMLIKGYYDVFTQINK